MTAPDCLTIRAHRFVSGYDATVRWAAELRCPHGLVFRVGGPFDTFATALEARMAAWRERADFAARCSDERCGEIIRGGNEPSGPGNARSAQGYIAAGLW